MKVHTVHIVWYETIPHDFVCSSRNHQSCSEKIQIDHGDKLAANQIRNISANIAPFFIRDDRHCSYNLGLMRLCSDPHGKKKPLSTPSREIIDSEFGHLQMPTIQEE